MEKDELDDELDREFESTGFKLALFENELTLSRAGFSSLLLLDVFGNTEDADDADDAEDSVAFELFGNRNVFLLMELLL
jgi:hypothetical protein